LIKKTHLVFNRCWSNHLALQFNVEIWSDWVLSVDTHTHTHVKQQPVESFLWCFVQDCVHSNRWPTTLVIVLRSAAHKAPCGAALGWSYLLSCARLV